MDYRDQWRALAGSPSPDALVEHFAVFSDRPAARVLLRELLLQARGVTVVRDHPVFGPDSEVLQISFPPLIDGQDDGSGKTRTLVCSTPAEVPAAADVPPSLVRVTALHNQIAILDGFGQVTNAFYGLDEQGGLMSCPSFEPGVLGEGDNQRLAREVEKAGRTLAALPVIMVYDSSDWVLCDPTHPTRAGEACLRIISHESCDVDEPLSNELPAAAALLGLLVARLLGFHHTQIFRRV